MGGCGYVAMAKSGFAKMVWGWGTTFQSTPRIANRWCDTPPLAQYTHAHVYTCTQTVCPGMHCTYLTGSVATQYDWQHCMRGIWRFRSGMWRSVSGIRR